MIGSIGTALRGRAELALAVAAAVPPVLRGGLLPPPHQLPRTVLALARNGGTLALLAELAAVRFPDRPAVIDEFGEISFAELHRRVVAIAGAMHEAWHIGPGSAVAVLARNHRHFPEAVLAASRLGAELVLLNTELATDQLARILARHRPELLVADAELVEALPTSAYPGPRVLALGPGEGVTLDALAGSGLAAPRGRLQGPITMLTSGTTGLAKSAPRQTGIAAGLSMAGALPVLALETTDVIYAAPPFFHFYGFGMLTAGLALGATVVTRRSFDPSQVLEAVEQHRVTVLPGVPTMHQRLLDLPGADRYDTSSVRLVLTGAAPVSPTLSRRLQERYGPVLVNAYGATELGVLTLAAPEDLRECPETVGRALPGVSLRILRPDRTQAPPGEVGELFARGPMMFAGYTGGTERKEEVDGHLSTGDLARLDDRGRLFVVGRADDMIVSGGENIFTNEVEDVLAGHPDVADAAVVGVPDEDLGSRMRAYLVLRAGATITLDEVKDYVRARLERYKVPRELVLLDELPRNATGKILHARLRVPVSDLCGYRHTNHSQGR